MNENKNPIFNRLSSMHVPMKANDSVAGFLDDAARQEIELRVADAMQGVLQALLIDTSSDHNTRETAKRVAKMMVHETYRGRFHPAPAVTAFPNDKKLDELYCTGPITVRSACSHHLVPIIGQAWIGIIPGDFVLGLSKFNRIVDWISSRPQIQEEMVVQIADTIERLAKPKGLAVVIKAQHMCMTMRGVKETADAMMTTSVMRGLLKDRPEARAEFLSLISRG